MLSVEGTLQGRVVLLTGFTGFVGKCLAEKILRAFPGVRKVLLLVRRSKDMNALQRVRGIFFESECFRNLRCMHGSRFPEFFEEKVGVLEADLEQDRLGLSTEGWHTALESNIIINCAANVDFNQRLDLQINTNLFGCLRLLDVARSCPAFVAFVHCSTAYCNCDRLGFIPETLPDSSNWRPFVDKVMGMAPPQITSDTPALLGKFPNTYTLSKNLSEKALLSSRGSIPVAIVRPSIIGCAETEPVPGWIDAVSAAAALYLCAGTGLVSCIHGSVHVVGDQVPVDYVVDSLLIAAASAAADGPSRDAKVFMCGSSQFNPVTWGESALCVVDYFRHRPPPRQVRRPEFEMFKYKYQHSLYMLYSYTLPGLLLRAQSALGSTSASALQVKWQSATKKAMELMKTFEHFTCNSWVFEASGIRAAAAELSAKERRLLHWDICEVDWKRYLSTFCYGLSRYILRLDVTQPRVLENVILYNQNRASLQGFGATVGEGGGCTDQVVAAVMQSAQVRAAIARLRPAFSIDPSFVPVEVDSQALAIAVNMASRWNRTWILCTKAVLRQILLRLFDSVLVDADEMNSLREQLRSSRSIPLLFMPNHRSYFDFLLLSYIAITYDLPVPHIAAAEVFLDLGPVTSILRHGGAFFINRSSSDVLQSAVLEAMMEILLRERKPIEFFFEGTRSRLGRMLPPRTGLLSIATDLVVRKDVEDVFISAVAITYDCVIEANMYAHELTGAPKIPESFSSFLSSASVLRRKFGSVHVRFPPLLSVRAIMSNDAASVTNEPVENEEVNAMEPPVSESGAAGPVMQGLLGPRGQVAEATAAAVVNALVHNTVITSSGLAAAVIFSCRSAGDNVLAMSVLGSRILQLRRHLTDAGAEATDSRWNGLAIAEYAMQFLRPHVEFCADGVKPPRDVRSLLVLAQHVGPLVDRCKTESIVCLCIQRSSSNPRAAFLEIAPLLYACIAPCSVADAVDFGRDFDACVERMLASGVLLHQHSFSGGGYSIREDSVVVQVISCSLSLHICRNHTLYSGSVCAC
jgi:thioester reductase-like protein/1-acyl-sn-glycerol-3-phosphate acyltransferase